MSQYLLTCTAVVNGEPVSVQRVVNAEGYDTDPALRQFADAELRSQLAFELVKKWQPKIKKRPVPDTSPFTFLAG